MKKFIITSIFLAIVLMGLTAFAAENEITIKNGGGQDIEIKTESSVIDIPIKVSGYSDVYAFQISMDYSPDKIKIESLSNGEIFTDFGSAVLKNDVDNSTGHAEMMQTILGVDSGTNDDGTLCTIRLSLKDGEYNFADDLGIELKLVNSTPEYMNVNIPNVKIAVDTENNNSTNPTSDVQPTETPVLGVITPDPHSENSQDFEVAEDESMEEIIAKTEQEAYGKDKEVKVEKQSNEEFTQETVKEQVVESSNITKNEKQQKDNNQIMFIIAIILAILIISLLVIVILMNKAIIPMPEKIRKLLLKYYKKRMNSHKVIKK